LIPAIEGAQGPNTSSGLVLVEEVSDQSGGGGLSVGAGYANQRQGACWVTVPCASEYQRGLMTVPHDNFRYSRLLPGFNHDRTCSAANGITDKAMSISL
jgi:hypothetical protein